VRLTTRHRLERACLVAGLAVAIGSVAVLVLPPVPLSGEPSPDPSASSRPAAHEPSCQERYPAEGPGGVDLQLGCMVNELVGFYLGAGGASTAEPARISAYLVPLGSLLALAIVAVLLTRRVLGRRLVSASPAAFWQCPACRSVNRAGAEACYSCRRPWEPGATEFRTDGEPPAPQSFGRRHDGR
jgi:hypothetical protein